MNRIEKVLQNDDSTYIYFVKVIKTFVVFLSFYIFSILEKNSIYELTNIDIFIKSNFFLIAFYISILYFITSDETALTPISLIKTGSLMRQSIISCGNKDDDMLEL